MSGGFNQTWGKRKFNPSMEKKLREFRDRIIKKNITFSNVDFSNFPRKENILYFVDPPYYITSTGYNTTWGVGNERKIYDYLNGLSFLMTNFISRGNLRNDILETAISKNGWSYMEIRGGMMKGQKNREETYIEILVGDSQQTLNKIKKAE